MSPGFLSGTFLAPAFRTGSKTRPSSIYRIDQVNDVHNIQQLVAIDITAEKWHMFWLHWTILTTEEGGTLSTIASSN